jgi:hypothetical protein
MESVLTDGQLSSEYCRSVCLERDGMRRHALTVD